MKPFDTLQRLTNSPGCQRLHGSLQGIAMAIPNQSSNTREPSSGFEDANLDEEPLAGEPPTSDQGNLDELCNATTGETPAEVEQEFLDDLPDATPANRRIIIERSRQWTEQLIDANPDEALRYYSSHAAIIAADKVLTEAEASHDRALRHWKWALWVEGGKTRLYLEQEDISDS